MPFFDIANNFLAVLLGFQGRKWGISNCGLMYPQAHMKFSISSFLTVFLAVLLGAGAAKAQNPASWMSGLDGYKYISELSIPGSHDSGSTVGILGYTRDQTLSIADQLAVGVRFFDIRLAAVARRPTVDLVVSHGGILQSINFKSVVTNCLNFLDAHPTETIIMSVKEEASSQSVFESLVYKEVSLHPNRFWLKDYIPRLSDVRAVSRPSIQNPARIVLIRRFSHHTTGVPLPFGMDATAWPDNAVFAIRNMKIEDVYKNPGEYAKLTYVEDHIRRAALTNSNPYFDPSDGKFHPQDINLYITFTSGYGNPLDSHPIADYSDTINPALPRFLDLYSNERVGIVVMDFVNAPLATAVIKTNTFI
jgi:1-phosphatidylinositol phosphodiesterase